MKEEEIQLIDDMDKSLKRKRDDEEEISLMEFYERMKRRRLISTDDDIPYIRSIIPTTEQKIPMRKRRPISIRSPLSMKRKTKSLIRSLVSIYEQEEKKKKKKKKKKKNTEAFPVFELASQYFFGDGVESEEEVLGDDDREEDCSGYKFVINENKFTYTRVKVPIKIYFRNGSVLDNVDYPVPTLAKLALDRYNAIECTNYKYVGLVKAYASPVGAVNYTVRFQARLPDQDPVYFQAIIIERLPNSANEVLVEVVLVHRLP